ncbi:MAG: hypothetical protein AB7I79_05280 [Rhizobiaceae bacterium]
MRRTCALLVLLVGPAFAAVAEEAGTPGACVHGPAILAASEVLLREPAEKPRFWRDRFGHDAAYLTIRYAGLDFEAADALLAGLESRDKPPERMLGLRLSHNQTPARMARLAALGPSVRDGTVLPSLDGSILRALVLEDGGDWLVAETRRWFDAQPDSPLRQTFAANVARSIADADDAAKLDFADKAEAAGLWPLAFTTHAVRDDLAGVAGLLDRAPAGSLGDPGQDPAAWREGMLRHALTMAELRDTFDMTIQPLEVRALDGRRPYASHFRAMYRLVGRAPDVTMILTLLNQTGEYRIATELTPELLAAIADGRLDPVGAPAGVVVAMVEGLDRLFGRDVREAQLATFKVTVGPAGTPAQVATDFADRMIARHALAPVVLGATPSLERSPLLTEAFDWQRHHAVAAALASGGPIGDEDALIAVDLLVGASRFGEAAAMLGRMSDVPAAQPAAHALATQLDRACLDALAPALPLHESVFRFYPR